MILKADVIAAKLRSATTDNDPFVISPTPDLSALEESGSAAVDLRLGTWFSTPRQARTGFLDVNETSDEARLMRQQYVPFGEKYFLHPQSFVLGVTLEWLRFPHDLGGYVIGKSSWGRRGLVIATATGVHPGFTGCLTLELTNLGEMPLAISPGCTICQLFLHGVETNSHDTDRSGMVGQRKPILGRVTLDSIAKKLAAADKAS